MNMYVTNAFLSLADSYANREEKSSCLQTRNEKGQPDHT